MGHVEALKLLHPTKHRSSFSELRIWLSKYNDQYESKRIYKLAIKRMPSGSQEPLKNKYPDNIYLMSGLHPTNVKENFNDELEFVVNSLKTQDYVAIGEIGIDLYWDKSFLNEQQEAFTFQIRLAIKHDLPIVIHCREAFDEIFEILDRENCNKLRGVFHCFTGTLEQAKRAIDLGFVLGIGGVVTFKNGGIDKFLNQIDLKHIVLETDSPYLAPVPHRGKRNESKYLIHVLEKIALIHQRSEGEIAAITSQNALSVFKF